MPTVDVGTTEHACFRIVFGIKGYRESRGKSTMSDYFLLRT
jgi:hypothetical protein